MGTSREMNTLLLARQEGGDWQRDEHVTVNKTGMGEWELEER